MEARNRIAAKLRGQEGVTMVFALLGFLFASILCVTIVNGALTAVQNANDQYLQEQSFLSVSSAAIVLNERLTGEAHFMREISVTREWYDAPESVETQYTVSGETDGFFRFPSEDAENGYEPYSGGADPMMSLVCELYTGERNVRKTLTFGKPEKNGGAPLSGMKEVSVALSMDASGNLTARLRSDPDGDADSALPCYMTEYFECGKTTNQYYTDEDGDGNETLVKITKLIWTLDRVERGSWGDWNESNESYEREAV